MRTRRLSTWSGAVLAIVLGAMGAHASVCLADPPAPPSDAARAEAMKKYEEGSKAFAAKQYKDAIDLFLAADQTVPNADLAYNTSLAYEAMGDAESALRWAREYLRRAGAADDRTEVQGRVSKLERKLQQRECSKSPCFRRRVAQRC